MENSEPQAVGLTINTCSSVLSEKGDQDKGYVNSRQYINDYMSLLSLKLHREVLYTRAMRGEERNESFLGLFVSDDDVTTILSELNGYCIDDFPEQNRLEKKILLKKQLIKNRTNNTDSQLPVEKLQQTFELAGNEAEMLLLALAIEVDHRFSKVFGYLHDDVNRKNISAFLVERIISNAGGKDWLTTALRQDSALLSFGLIQLLDDPTIPLFSRGIKLDSRIASYLLGDNRLDDSLYRLFAAPWFADCVFESDLCTESATNAAESWLSNQVPMVLRITPSSDIDVWFSIFCGQVKLGLLVVDWHQLNYFDINMAEILLRKSIREAHLSNSILHIQNIDFKDSRLLTLLYAIITPLVFLSTIRDISSSNFSHFFHMISLPTVSAENRHACWCQAIKKYQSETMLLSQEITNRFQLSARQIDSIVKQVAYGFSGSKKYFNKQLEIACRHQVGQSMQGVAQRVDTNFLFNDLILSEQTAATLEQLIERQNNSVKVLQRWGLGELFHQPAGNSVLFVGPSGTGKTMAASVIGNELCLDMYRIDLSGVVSKYIGETEKNLEKIFAAAAQSQVVLFIDEADALFGKRSEVKDAHDRYANIEVSYLLQKMESHDGIVILASNFGNNIDDAFYRRFSFVVEFSLPRPEERYLLWKKITQGEVPLSDNIDFNFLAENFDMTGGHIKNCILSAAYQAAELNKPVDMELLVRAIAQEFTKIGKPISRNLFGDFYTSIRRDVIGR